MAQPAVQPKRFGRVPLRLLDDTINGRLTKRLSLPRTVPPYPSSRAASAAASRASSSRSTSSRSRLGFLGVMLCSAAVTAACTAESTAASCLARASASHSSLTRSRPSLVLGLPHLTRLGDPGVSLESGGGGLLSGPRRAGRFHDRRALVTAEAMAASRSAAESDAGGGEHRAGVPAFASRCFSSRRAAGHGR